MRSLLLALMLCVVATAARATTLTVTTIADAGPGSLREAIEEMNTLAATTPLLTFRIEFDTGTSNHIVLQSPLPPITGRFVTLAGEGMRVTGINGNWQHRVLESGAGNLLLALEDIGLHNGAAEHGACIGGDPGLAPVRITLLRAWLAQCFASVYGGAIVARETLEVRDSVFLSNRVYVNVEDWGSGGAIYKTGAGEMIVERTLFETNGVLISNGNLESTGGGGAIMLHAAASDGHRIEDSVFSANTVGNADASQDARNWLVGGAVQTNGGALTISRTVFRDNHALRAGGALALTGWIFDPATVRLDNASFHDNSAGSQGGAVHLGPFAGDPLRLQVRNSLFYRSRAEGALVPAGTAVHHLHVTQPSEVSVANSVFAEIGGHEPSDSAVVCNATGTASATPRHNAILEGLVADCDIGGDVLVAADLGLGWVGKYAEPLALEPASPLIDAGHPGSVGEDALVCAADDGLGFARPLDGDGDGLARCDIGPLEYRPAPIFRDGFE